MCIPRHGSNSDKGVWKPWQLRYKRTVYLPNLSCLSLRERQSKIRQCLAGMRVRPEGPQLISEMVRRTLGIDCSVLMGANIAEAWLFSSLHRVESLWQALIS